MAKPTFVNFAGGGYHNDGGGGGAIAVNLPADIASGDLILICCVCNNGAPSFTISGYDLLFNDYMSTTMSMRVYRRMADGSEGATVDTSSLSNTYEYSFSSIAYRGAADPIGTGDTPYNYAGLDMSYVSGSVESPAATAAADDSLVLRFLASRNPSSLPAATTPTSHTARGSYHPGVSVGAHRVAEQDAAASTGAVSAAAWTSCALSNWGAGTLVLEPAAAAAPTVNSVTISGTSQIGQTLTANVTTSPDPVDSVAYQWEISDDGGDPATNGEDLTGETSATLALTYTDFASRLDANGNAYVRVSVIATEGAEQSAEVSSAWQEVTAPSGGGDDSPLGTPCILV